MTNFKSFKMETWWKYWRLWWILQCLKRIYWSFIGLCVVGVIEVLQNMDQVGPCGSGSTCDTNQTWQLRTIVYEFLERQNIIFGKNMSYVIFQTWLLKCYSASLKRKWNISLAQHNGLLIVWHSCYIISKTSNWDLCGGILMDTTGFGQYSTKYSVTNRLLVLI